MDWSQFQHADICAPESGKIEFTAQINLDELCLGYISDSIKTRPTHRRTDANLYPLERQLTKVSEPSFDLEGGAARSNLTTPKDS